MSKYKTSDQTKKELVEELTILGDKAAKLFPKIRTQKQYIILLKLSMCIENAKREIRR